MDKRQAIEFLGYLMRDKNIERTIYEDALKIAIESLKAQLYKESTTKDAISRQAALDELNVSAELLRRVLDDADIVGVERAKYKWGLDLIEASIADVKELPPAQPEPSIPLSWIEAKIEWLNNMDNYFAELTANIIKTMLNEWRKGEQDETD